MGNENEQEKSTLMNVFLRKVKYLSLSNSYLLTLKYFGVKCLMATELKCVF